MQDAESIHPSLWRASQLGRAEVRCIDTGHMALSNQLPGGGWPVGAAIELMVQQAGIGEMRVIGPALAKMSHKKVVLIAPPKVPNIIALSALGIAPSDAIWMPVKTHADVLWSADQIARSGAFGAVVVWTDQIRTENVRRLNLAAQTGDTLMFIMRPITAARDASPASLRLSLRPAAGGVNIGFIKRRGPVRDEPLFLPLPGPFTPRPVVPRQATVVSDARVPTGIAQYAD